MLDLRVDSTPATSLQAGPLPPGTLERLPLSELTFYDEEHYGRPLDQRRLSILRADWNEQKAGVIYVSRRRNTITLKPVLSVIDGHHRVTIATEKGMTDIPALVWDKLTIRQEAALYAAFGSVLRQSAMQVFRARLTAGDKRALSLNQTIVDAGFSLGFGNHHQKAPEKLGNVATLERFFQRYGAQHLYNTLRLLDDLFPGEPKRTRDYVIHALALLLRFYPDIDRERLKSHVTDAGFLSVVSRGNGIAHTMGVAVYHGFGEALISTYNKYGGAKLPRWNEQVPLKDFTDIGRENIGKAVRSSNLARSRNSHRTVTASKTSKHPTGTAGKRVVWNSIAEDPLARPD